MQKAQFIALLRYLLNRTVLPHPLKRLIYSMSSPLLHFHFLHCLSSSLKPTSPTEIMWATQLCELHWPGLGKALHGGTSRRAWNSCALAKPCQHPQISTPSALCCSTQGSQARHLNAALSTTFSFTLVHYNTESKIIRESYDYINYIHDTVQ